MKEEIAAKLMALIDDLLDEENLAFYALVMMLIMEPSLRELITGGILGYWTKRVKGE